MLIDWVTARLSYEHFTPEEWQKVIKLSDRIVRFSQDKMMKDDVYLLIDHESVEWECGAWDSVRSDSHQIAFRVGTDALWIQGSPARIIGNGCATFGSGASRELDISGCVKRMAAFVSQMVEIPLFQPVEKWIVSRVDVTGNILMDSLADVRIALSVLKDCEGGRYKVSQQSGDTVYWQHRSALRKGKAYAKGPQLKAHMKKRIYTGYQYSHEELTIAENLLRLELTLGSQFFRELQQRRNIKHWTQLTKQHLLDEWKDYFHRMIGDAEMTNDKQLKQKVIDSGATKGQGKSAYKMLLAIKNEGWQVTRNETSDRTWYRNLKTLRNAGLGDADIAKGTVVQFRRKILTFNLVNSFQEAA